MSGPDRAELLRQLAAGVPLADAAARAGYGSVEGAADALTDLAARADRAPSRRGARDETALALPPAPPEVSPYVAGARAVLQTDGASRGNPGPAAYGCVYLTEEGTPLCGEGAPLGRATNNVAEYQGLLAGLRRLHRWGVRRALVRLDSQLVVRQLSGSYKVRHPDLQPLHREARRLLEGLQEAEVQHIPREANALADALANRALDAAGP